MDLSWVRGTIRGWTVMAWWVILPLRALAMALSIISDMIFVGIFALIAALYLGMIPETTIRDSIDHVGHRIESYVMPEFRPMLHGNPSGHPLSTPVVPPLPAPANPSVVMPHDAALPLDQSSGQH